MGECRLDHSTEDVRDKLKQQSHFLPQDIQQQLQAYVDESLEQDTLNKIFHLLKKYDLSASEEQKQRDIKLQAIMQSTSQS